MDKIIGLQSLNLLREMVTVPSVSFEETAVADLISNRLSAWGVVHERLRNNLVAGLEKMDPNKKTLVLDAHIDTVPVCQGWTCNPFDPAGPDNNQQIIYGLGSNDDGGCVVAMIAAYRHFLSRELPFNLILALSCEEERSGENGARWLYGPEGPLHPEMVIIGEPTGLKAATSERGLLVIDAVAEGKSGHAARNEGINALYIALDDIAAIRSHKFSRISPTMGEVHKTVTIIHSGTAHNVVPDRCEFTIDIRPTEVYTCAEILDELQSICKSRLKARNLNNRSSATRNGSPLFKALDGLGIEKFSSPTTSDWMRIDSDCVKIGPGESSRSHKSDEFITVEEVQNGIETYINLIGELAKLF